MEDQLIRGHKGMPKYTKGAISEHQSRRLVAERRIKFIKPSGERGPVYFRASDVDAFLKACEQPAEIGPAAKRRR
ncbi:MAG: hypothetical protein IRY92_07370 [Dactylosporangium sp.]|nr:hypothetical protein [Dactylosporangium sp.]